MQIFTNMLCIEVDDNSYDEIMEKLKNLEKLSNVLPVSIKRIGNIILMSFNVLQNEHNTYIGVQTRSKKIEEQFHVMLNTSLHRQITNVGVKSVFFTSRPPTKLTWFPRNTIHDARNILQM